MNSERAGRAPHHWMRQVPAQPQCRLSVDRQIAANDLNGGREAGTAHCKSLPQLELLETMEFFLDLALMRVL